jgi:periplasmic divalent cation tolerance protein
MTGTKAALIWCPFPTTSAAQEAGRALIEDGLAACANIIPQVHSLFAWQGVVEEASEAILVLKTRASLLENATARLAVLHSYDTPAITGWLTDHTPAATLEWLSASLPAGPAQ